MNISNHFYQRYHERVRKNNEPFTDSLKDPYEKEIEKLYSHCTKMYSGIIGHSTKPVDVYINQHGWVIVANDKENILITVYKIDLQVDDDNLNKSFIEKSLNKINDIQEKLLQKSVEVDEERKSLREKIESNEERIKELQTQISKLKEANSAYGDLIKVADSDLYQIKVELRDAIENYMIKDAVKIDLGELK